MYRQRHHYTTPSTYFNPRSYVALPQPRRAHLACLYAQGPPRVRHVPAKLPMPVFRVRLSSSQRYIDVSRFDQRTDQIRNHILRLTSRVIQWSFLATCVGRGASFLVARRTKYTRKTRGLILLFAS